MEILQESIQYILDLGPGVFMPIIMFILGIIFRMDFKKNISSSLLIGVAFTGMSLVMGFMTGAISPAAQQLVENTGKELTALDVGWTPLAAISWAWPYAFLIFPLQIGINVIMVIIKQTDTINVDMWNVWNKILTAVLVFYVSQNLFLAFIAASIQIILELKMGEWLQPSVEKITGIPSVTVTHPHALYGIFLGFGNWVLDKIPGIKNIEIDSKKIRSKIGVFGENHVMGFFLGMFIGILAGYNFQETLKLSIKSGTALYLLPMVAKLFMTSLTPLSDAASSYMKERFPDRKLIIGLDWPILAGRSEIWVVMILIIPLILLSAFFVPGNKILPFGGILMTGLAFTTLIITDGNLLKMLILSVVSLPIYLLAGTYLAPGITELAKSTGGIEVEAGQMITRMGIEAPIFRMAIMEAAKITKGEWLAIIWILLYFAAWFLFRRYIKSSKGLNDAK